MTKVYRAAIVDDEPFVRADLRYLLSAMDRIDVVWEAGSINQAKVMLKTRETDLVFLDIRIRGGSGFDLIPLINPAKTHLIVVPAHEKYFSRARQTFAQECLLKPVSSRALAKVINQIVLDEHAG